MQFFVLLRDTPFGISFAQTALLIQQFPLEFVAQALLPVLNGASRKVRDTQRIKEGRAPAGPSKTSSTNDHPFQRQMAAPGSAPSVRPPDHSDPAPAPSRS